MTGAGRTPARRGHANTGDQDTVLDLHQLARSRMPPMQVEIHHLGRGERLQWQGRLLNDLYCNSSSSNCCHTSISA